MRVPLALALVLFFAFVASTVAARPSTPTAPDLALEPSAQIVRSTSTTLGGLARTSVDTFVLYGGPYTLEGKFQDALGQPDFGGWTGVDRTELPVHWHVSTFNAETLGGHGPGNRAMWCGADDPAWANPPGYGNNWVQDLVYESEPIADPSVGQTIDFDFVFHHDTEVAYDFFEVWVDSVSHQRLVLEVDGTNAVDGVFAAPGVRFSDLATTPITFEPNGYSHDDRIRITLRFYSDGAWSDQDGLIDTQGAVQIDDITLVTSQGSFSEDFEGPGPYLFEPQRQPFFGDFSDVYSGLTDLDPCRSNPSGVVGFIDYGQEVRNGPSPSGTTSTGGSTSPNWDYGLPGGWVVNHDAGIGEWQYLANEVWSPVIQWDASGTDDDGLDVAGLRLSWDVWGHLPFQNFLFWTWHVRSRTEGGTWSPWRSTSTYYTGTPIWRRFEVEAGHLLVDDPAELQLSLGVTELPVDGFPPDDSTPAPWFDDVRVEKYRVGGVGLFQSSLDRAQDAFPPNGLIASATLAERDLLDVRFDSNSLRGGGVRDSVVVGTEVLIPGTTVDEVVMVWELRRNTYFDDELRALPAGSFDRNVTVDENVWSGEVVMQPTWPQSNLYFADLPDEDFLYPGDVLQYYFRATDSEGRVTTLPSDLTGFGEFFGPFDTRTPYDIRFTMRGLPTLGTTILIPVARDWWEYEDPPHALVVADFSRFDDRAFVRDALYRSGYLAGYNMDVLYVQSGGSGDAVRLSSTGQGGASLQQLERYDTIVYLASRPQVYTFQDDLALLEQWRALPGDRVRVWFGDDFVQQVGATFAADALGAELVASNALDLFGTRDTIEIVPALPGFGESFEIEATCPSVAPFDAIIGTVGQDGHVVTEVGGLDPLAGLIGSVVFERTDGLGDRDLDITFPFDFDRIRSTLDPTDTWAAGRVLRDVLLFAGTYQGGIPVAAPSPRTASLEVAPNPFNPSTVVRLTLPEPGPASVRIYDARGQLVRTLVTQVLDAGRHELEWNGLDDREQPVGSGVYLVRATGVGTEMTRKVALVK